MKISLSFALLLSLVTWLILGENSPFKGYFLQHVLIPNLWGQLLIVPYLILIIVRPRFWVDQISYALIFLQWLLFGFVLSLLVCRRFPQHLGLG